MTERTRQVTVRASAGQVSNWESAARYYNRPVQKFVALAASMVARRLREIERQRAFRDPVAQRLQEKRLLGRLLDAARAAEEHLPKHVDSHTYGRLNPKGDLRRAVEDVRDFLAEMGEEYGPCD